MREKKIKNLLSLFLVTILMLVVIGCSNESSVNEGNSDGNNNEASNGENKNDGAPVYGGELGVAHVVPLSNSDPIKGTQGGDHTILWLAYDTLTNYNSELEVQPGLAESWEMPDDKTIVLNLKEDVTFHDGTPFNAEAVKFNIERANSEESVISDLLSIEEVEVVDEHTVALHLVEPDASVLLALSDRGGMMVSPTAIEELGEDYYKTPIGTGPFVMTKVDYDNEIILEKNEDYWNADEVYLDKVTFKIMIDENARINALRSGQIDIADHLSPGNIDTLESEQNITVLARETVANTLLGFNTTIPPLDNKNIRKAILHGIDREALNKAIFFDRASVANQLFPDDYWASDPDLKIDYDPEKSKQLLKEEGLENVSIEIVHASHAENEKMSNAIKAQLSEVGIDVKLTSLEQNTAVARFAVEGAVPILYSGWSGRPDPGMTITSFVSEKGTFNGGKVSEPETEELIKKANSTYDLDERAELYREIARKSILEDVNVIPLVNRPKVVATNEKVQGFELDLYGKNRLAHVWKVD